MDTPIDHFWTLKLEACKTALENNRFRAFVADTPSRARTIVEETLLPKWDVGTASWGDSMTLEATGILEMLANRPDIDLIRTFETGVSGDTIFERRRQALLADLFFSGSNAVTENGQLVNLDMVGNRVGGITFGPRQVVLLVGRNKIVPDLESAIQRIKSQAAPANALRHDTLRTPCRKTALCMDCKSPDRICNTWVITEKSFPEGRITVILINQDLGL